MIKKLDCMPSKTFAIKVCISFKELYLFKHFEIYWKIFNTFFAKNLIKPYFKENINQRGATIKVDLLPYFPLLNYTLTYSTNNAQIANLNMCHYY